jgi:hypothetical protein
MYLVETVDKAARRSSNSSLQKGEDYGVVLNPLNPTG